MIIQQSDGVYDYDIEKDTITKIEIPMIVNQYTGVPIKFIHGKLKGKYARIVRKM